MQAIQLILNEFVFPLRDLFTMCAGTDWENSTWNQPACRGGPGLVVVRRMRNIVFGGGAADRVAPGADADREPVSAL